MILHTKHTQTHVFLFFIMHFHAGICLDQDFCPDHGSSIQGSVRVWEKKLCEKVEVTYALNHLFLGTRHEPEQ